LNQQDPSLAEPFIEAARELESRGVKAITGACGFMALFQEQVTAAVEIPVFLSSLTQIGFMHAVYGGKVGIITANSERLTPRHFEASGVPVSTPLAVAGMQGQVEFREAVLKEKGTLDSAKVEREVVEVARGLISQHPEVRSILLECSDLPPYAAAIQEACGKPIFDFITMIDYVHGSLHRRPYHGRM
jgi:Asp/Glu/hydantoin racemase